MTYQPHTWTKGETITAQLLQNMDNGVAAAIDALESAFGSNYTMGSKEYKVNFTNLGKDISANAIQGTTLTATSAISGNTLDITTDSDLKGDVDIGGTLTVEQIKAGETDDIQLNGKLIVIGKDAEVDNSTVKQAASFTGTLNVSGATALDDQLTVTGDTILKGNLTVGNETATGKKAIRLNDTIKIDTDSSNRIIIGGQTQINAPVTIGSSQTYHAVKIYGIPTIYGQTLSITNPSMKPMIKLKPTGEITAKTLVIDNELTIGTASSQTAEATGSTRLYGTTTIDKLIVGDSTTTADNEIYGFTTISDLTAGNLTVGTPTVESDSETQTYSGTATFNTSEIIFNQPASFFNNNVKTEHIEITSRSIKQSIGDQTYDLILQNGTDIYFGASNNNTFIRGNSVTIVENDLKFTMHNSTDTYTYRFADNGQAGFKLTANYDSSDSSPQPNHTLFHYRPSAFDDDMLIVGGLSNSVASTDTSLVQDVFINAEDSIILTTKNTTGIRINNNTAIAGTLKVQKIQTTVYDDSTLDGKKGYKYNYTLLTSSTLGLFSLQCSGTDNSNQSLTKSPVLFSYRPYGFESESYLTIGGPSLTPSNGDNKCVENMYIKAKENITLSPTSSTGKVTVNSDLHINGKKSLYMRDTVLSEMDIIHLHTLWNNYQTQNGGE